MTHDQEYRREVRDLVVRSEAEYDRTLLTLAGGALTLSVAFARDIAGPDPRAWWSLMVAWALWAASLACLLWSHFSSARAMRSVLDHVDGRGGAPDGGKFARVTPILNFTAGIAFVAGLAFFATFVIQNRRHHAGRPAVSTLSAAAASTSTDSTATPATDAGADARPAGVHRAAAAAATTGSADEPAAGLGQ
jgi:hypothetical protein